MYDWGDESFRRLGIVAHHIATPYCLCAHWCTDPYLRRRATDRCVLQPDRPSGPTPHIAFALSHAARGCARADHLGRKQVKRTQVEVKNGNTAVVKRYHPVKGFNRRSVVLAIETSHVSESQSQYGASKCGRQARQGPRSWRPVHLLT